MKMFQAEKVSSPRKRQQNRNTQGKTEERKETERIEESNDNKTKTIHASFLLMFLSLPKYNRDNTTLPVEVLGG